jgi:hypothetical protein
MRTVSARRLLSRRHSDGAATAGREKSGDICTTAACASAERQNATSRRKKAEAARARACAADSMGVTCRDRMRGRHDIANTGTPARTCDEASLCADFCSRSASSAASAADMPAFCHAPAREACRRRFRRPPTDLPASKVCKLERRRVSAELQPRGVDAEGVGGHQLPQEQPRGPARARALRGRLLPFRPARGPRRGARRAAAPLVRNERVERGGQHKLALVHRDGRHVEGPAESRMQLPAPSGGASRARGRTPRRAAQPRRPPRWQRRRCDAV